MNKEFLFNFDARRKLLNGVKTVYRAVSPTAGPGGKLVAIDRGYSVDVTKDGVTAAKAIDLEDKFENMGAQLVKEAAAKSGEVGDGTTTCTILAYALAEEGEKAIENGVSPTVIKKGMKKAVDLYTDYIETRATQIVSKDDIYNIAKVSSNGDENIAKLVTDAFDKLGYGAVITTSQSQTSETSLLIKTGLSFDKGMVSNYFANNEKMQSVLEDAYVLVTDQTISTVSQLLPIMGPVSKTGKPLFIVAEDITGEALPVLIANNVKQALRCNAVKAPSYGSNKKEVLQDIAIATGAVFVTEDMGISVSDVTLEMLGSAEKIISDAESTTIINGRGEKELVEKRKAELSVLAQNETNDRLKEKILTRLSKLSGGVCELNIAAATESLYHEIKDRVDDTICAIRASIKKGIVTGGGVTMLLATKKTTELTEDEKVGFDIVKRAMEYPIIKLAENADMDPNKVLKETLEKSDGMSGYNMETRKWEDDLYKRVVDPVLVETSALRNAFSVATLLLNTEVAIAEKKE